MRTLLTLTVVGILILAAGSVFAESHRQEFDQMAAYELRDALLDAQGHATLKLSPMYLEIHGINQAATLAEGELLAQLAACQDEGEVMLLVTRLERLDTSRQIDVLKVRMHYARLEGRHEMAFEIRDEITRLLEKERAPLM